MTLKVTERDKRLLCIIGAILIVFVSYYFGFKHFNEKADTLQSEVSDLDTRYRQLRNLYNQKDKFIQDTKDFGAEYNNIVANYESGVSQVTQSLFLSELENSTDAWIKQTSFAQSSMIYTFGQSPAEGADGGSTSYSTDYAGYQTILSLSYEAGYDDFKSMIDFINTYRYKCRIDAITMSYNEDDDIVSGTMSLSLFAITGSDRPFDNKVPYDINTGTDNIFSSGTFSGNTNMSDTNGNSILSDYDVYMSLQSSKSDVDSVVIGMKDDLKGSKTISSNSNSYQNVEIRFSGTEDNYSVQYKIGDVTYPATNYDQGESFVAGNNIALLIISSTRDTSGDKSGAHVNIINDTDKTVYVKVTNDDPTTPRFDNQSSQGDVVVY